MTGLMGWSAFIDDSEYVPELQWPNSVRMYDRMRTDAQIHALWLGMTLPIRRYKWELDPQDAPGTVVTKLARDIGLPIKGSDKPAKRTTHRMFSWDRHLYHALLSLLYGHMFFDMSGEYKDGDPLWHLHRLTPIMPKTVGEINVEKNGDLKSIRQNIGWQPPEIKVPQLVNYAWDQEGANYVGRSMLRPLYRHWLIKDRLLRVDALKHERNGIGVPIIEAPPNASEGQIKDLDGLAQEYKAGERSGGAIPNGSRLSLVGTSGSLPDTIQSIRYQDEAMARAWMLMFLQLGQTETGSRALGESFVDYTALAQAAVGIWVCETFNLAVIENYVDWNFGEDVPVPALVFEPDEDPALSVSDLTAMVEKGLITVDPELEDYMRRRYRLPEKPEEEDPEPEPTPPVPPGVVPPSPEDVAPEQQQASRRVLAAAGTANPAFLPPRELRRQLYDHEVQAQTDFAAIDFKIEDNTAKLVSMWYDVRAQQIADLVDQVAAAKGDLKKLAAIQAEAIGADTLRPYLLDSLESGAQLAVEEAERQGVKIAKPALDDAASHIAARADAIDSLLADHISESAARKALNLTGGSLGPEEVAQEVKAHLESLSDAYLRDQFNGAITQALNAGRREAFKDDEPSTYYASEILDTNTCTNCTAVDGRIYGPSLEAADRDYPTGGYKDCKGGPRCRGTIVAVYDEANPTV